jgi:hypothetical protein
LQFLVLARELPQLVLQPLDAHLAVGVIRLRKHLGGKDEERGNRCGV